jgi:hypothetical protein
MKKIIKLTEDDLTRIIRRVISEQSEYDTNLDNSIKGTSGPTGKPTGKLFFAFNNGITEFPGIIGSDGYLYPRDESSYTWKVGPIAKVPYTGEVAIRIDKRNGKEVIWVGRNYQNMGKLELVPNYTVKDVGKNGGPKTK